MTELLNLRGETVELPTAEGWVRPVNQVSLRIGAGGFTEFGPAKLILERPEVEYTRELLAAVSEISRPGQV